MSRMEIQRLLAGLRLLVQRGVIHADTLDLVTRLLYEKQLIPDPPQTASTGQSGAPAPDRL